MRKIILDTDAYSAYLTGEEKILNALAEAENVYFSIFVLAELYYGFQGGKREKQNLEILHRFLNKPTVNVLPGSEETAHIFADIKSVLKKSGKPIPLNDVWIAAHAIETGSVLITYDFHFTLVPGIRLWTNGFTN